MPSDPKDAHVNVILETENPVLRFRLESTDLPVGPNGELYFRNCGHRGFDVHFHLQDPKGLGYKFPPNSNKEAAIWSKVGHGVCPTTTAVWEIFEPRRVSNDQMTLIARNPNGSVQEFGYTLWVSKDGAAPFKDLDPGGFNQNGPESFATSNVLAAAVGGAVAGSLLTLGAQALMNS